MSEKKTEYQRAIDTLDNASIKWAEARRAVTTADTRLIEANNLAAYWERLYNEADQNLQTVKAKQAKFAEARKVYEAKAKEKAQATIAEQLASLSPERVAELLAEAGVRQIGPKFPTAAQVLSEARYHLEQSFWIKKQEVTTAEYVQNPWEVPEGLKGIAVKAGYEPDGYQVISGVCSVGAISLARAVLSGTPLTGWDSLAGSDRASNLAGRAVAWAIREDKPSYTSFKRTAGDIIIKWNDNPGTQREEVLRIWRAASKYPFLHLGDDEQLWSIGSYEAGNFVGLEFSSKEAAQTFIAEIGEKLQSGETRDPRAQIVRGGLGLVDDAPNGVYLDGLVNGLKAHQISLPTAQKVMN